MCFQIDKTATAQVQARTKPVVMWKSVRKEDDGSFTSSYDRTFTYPTTAGKVVVAKGAIKDYKRKKQASGGIYGYYDGAPRFWDLPTGGNTTILLMSVEPKDVLAVGHDSGKEVMVAKQATITKILLPSCIDSLRTKAVSVAAKPTKNPKVISDAKGRIVTAKSSRDKAIAALKAKRAEAVAAVKRADAAVSAAERAANAADKVVAQIDSKIAVEESKFWNIKRIAETTIHPAARSLSDSEKDDAVAALFKKM